MRTILSIVVLLAAASACVQGPSPAREPFGGGPALAPFETLAPIPQEPTPKPRPRRRGTPYGDTRVRLQVFREELEFDQFDVDFDSAPDADLTDAERDRTGFRGEFGSGTIGGFFQVFAEDYRAPSLLGEEFDLFGFGGGIAGTPDVGRAGPAEFVVPVRFAANIAGGSETVGGFDADFGYLEAAFEVGFGARAFGVQASSGIVVDSIAAIYESDDPARFANDDPAVITGTNVGIYFEGLYKHDRVPLMARARVVLGDVQGFLLTFGFAF
ncbi:MAG: hypothetical protein ACE37K_08610 [Planctomycetota bacterium]